MAHRPLVAAAVLAAASAGDAWPRFSEIADFPTDGAHGRLAANWAVTGDGCDAEQTFLDEVLAARSGALASGAAATILGIGEACEVVCLAVGAPVALAGAAATLGATAGGTRPRRSRIGHEFVAVDAATGADVASFAVAHDAVHVLSPRPRATSDEAEDYWAAKTESTLRYEERRSDKVKRSWTRHGFEKASLPDDLWADMATYWFNNRHALSFEEWDGKGAYVNWWEAPPEMCYLPFGLKGRWHDAIQVDRESTHAASVIVNVAQYGVDEPWMLHIKDLESGEFVDVPQRPGEIVFYESAKCLHGRPEPFRGEGYVNLFAHYRPKGRPEWYHEQNPDGYVPLDRAPDRRPPADLGDAGEQGRPPASARATAAPAPRGRGDDDDEPGDWRAMAEPGGPSPARGAAPSRRRATPPRAGAAGAPRRPLRPRAQAPEPLAARRRRRGVARRPRVLRRGAGRARARLRAAPPARRRRRADGAAFPPAVRDAVARDAPRPLEAWLRVARSPDLRGADGARALAPPPRRGGAAKLLLRAGADPDLPHGRSGDAPLHVAAAKGFGAVVKVSSTAARTQRRGGATRNSSATARQRGLRHPHLKARAAARAAQGADAGRRRLARDDEV
ncbi:hypothetical protein JL722_13139 [Aureococcus anophagefferens]|nr:hypothetical protein JL722_13139 [Aureococcus anophagefferens]